MSCRTSPVHEIEPSFILLCGALGHLYLLSVLKAFNAVLDTIFNAMILSGFVRWVEVDG